MANLPSSKTTTSNLEAAGFSLGDLGGGIQGWHREVADGFIEVDADACSVRFYRPNAEEWSGAIECSPSAFGRIDWEDLVASRDLIENCTAFYGADVDLAMAGSLFVVINPIDEQIVGRGPSPSAALRHAVS